MAEECRFVSPLGDDALYFSGFVGREALGRLPQYEIRLLRPSKKDPLQAKDLLGQVAGLRIRLPGDAERSINGTVVRFERGGVDGAFDVYRLELRPWLWQLMLGADCRIFQEQTALEIVKKVFAEYTSAEAIDDKVQGTLATRPFTVQYRESDFNFVSRLMEDEGIYYYFEHRGAKSRLVLCNGPSGHGKIGGETLQWAGTLQGNQRRDDIVTQWESAHELRSLKYAHTDFAAEAPSTSLLAGAERTAPYPKPNDLEVFDYPGGHDDLAMGTNTAAKVDAGKAAAKIKVDIFESGHFVSSGVTPWRELLVGSTFKLEGHPSNAGEFLVTESVSSLRVSGYAGDDEPDAVDYSCQFNAVPKAVAYQPEAAAFRPVVQGPQTATVVGNSGDEILTDKHGRVKLQFHWDRIGKKDSKSSAWVRVSHPWASKGFGMVALPRVGDEVVVEFLEGNPDRPLVTGRVYNGTNTAPYELPAQATVTGVRSRSSKGGAADNFNELRFDDKKGSEYVWLQAEKDFHRLVKNDVTDHVRGHHQLEIAKNHTARVGEEFALTIGKSAAVDVGADVQAKVAGDTVAHTGGKFDFKIGAGAKVNVATALDATAGTAGNLKFGTDLKASAGTALHLKAGTTLSIEAGVSISIKAGPSFVTIGPDGVSITGPMIKINSGGSASPASPASAASPAAPKAPAKVKEQKDPLVEAGKKK